MTYIPLPVQAQLWGSIRGLHIALCMGTALSAPSPSKWTSLQRKIRCGDFCSGVSTPDSTQTEEILVNCQPNQPWCLHPSVVSLLSEKGLFMFLWCPVKWGLKLSKEIWGLQMLSSLQGFKLQNHEDRFMTNGQIERHITDYTCQFESWEPAALWVCLGTRRSDGQPLLRFLPSFSFSGSFSSVCIFIVARSSSCVFVEPQPLQGPYSESKHAQAICRIAIEGWVTAARSTGTHGGASRVGSGCLSFWALCRREPVGIGGMFLPTSPTIPCFFLIASGSPKCEPSSCHLKGFPVPSWENWTVIFLCRGSDEGCAALYTL